MNLEYLKGAVRHVLTFAGGIVVARGYTDQTTVEMIIGGAVALAGVVWSILHKKAQAAAK